MFMHSCRSTESCDTKTEGETSAMQLLGQAAMLLSKEISLMLIIGHEGTTLKWHPFTVKFEHHVHLGSGFLLRQEANDWAFT